ncbi:MAG: cell division protein SepF [Ruminococcus sp.]|nr:cell division protein SepF [Ruminococcus sp.]
MAGIFDKLKNMWDSPDDEFQDDYGYDDYNSSAVDYDDNLARDSEGNYGRMDRNEARSYSDSYTDYEGRNKVVNISNAKIKVVLFKPERFGPDTSEIADELIKNNTVVLNLEDTNNEMSKRIIDFLSGVAYAKQGKLKRIAKSTFIIMPSNVDLTGDDLLGELENNGMFFK